MRRYFNLLSPTDQTRVEAWVERVGGGWTDGQTAQQYYETESVIMYADEENYSLDYFFKMMMALEVAALSDRVREAFLAGEAQEVEGLDEAVQGVLDHIEFLGLDMAEILELNEPRVAPKMSGKPTIQALLDLLNNAVAGDDWRGNLETAIGELEPHQQVAVVKAALRFEDVGSNIIRAAASGDGTTTEALKMLADSTKLHEAAKQAGWSEGEEGEVVWDFDDFESAVAAETLLHVVTHDDFVKSHPKKAERIQKLLNATRVDDE